MGDAKEGPRMHGGRNRLFPLGFHLSRGLDGSNGLNGVIVS